MRTTRVLLIPLAVCGCEQIEDITDYFSTVVAEALIVGTDDAQIAAHLGGTAAASAFLAHAQSLSDIEANLFDDAESVTVERDGESHALASQGDGLYLVTSVDDPALIYAAGASYTVQVVDAGKTFTAIGTAPPAPNLSSITAPPNTIPASSALTVDLTGQGYDNTLVAVVDADGNLTYDSRPADVSEYLDWIGDSGEVTTVTIPATAFPTAGAAYVVGIAGVIKAPDAGFEEFNPLLSNLAVGSMAAAPVLTAP